MKNRVRDVILRRSALIIMLILILGAISLLRIVTTYRDVDDVANIDLPLIEVLTQIETNQLEQSINLERAVRLGNDLSSESASQDFARSDSTFRYLAKIVDEDLLMVDQQVIEALSQTEQDQQQGKLRILSLSVKKLKSDHKNYVNHAVEVLRNLEEGQYEKSQVLMKQVAVEEDQFNKQIEGVLMRHEMFTESLVKIVEQEEILSMKWIVTLTLTFVIISIMAVYTFSYSIWRPLEDIRSGAERLGAGDYNARVKIRSNSITEEIVDAFNSMSEQLKAAQNNIDKFINFSYRATHDLKAPILNIQSLLDMLDSENINTSHYDSVLNNAKKSAKRLEVTVDALTEFNQIRESLGIRKEKLHFDDVLKEVVGALLPQIKEANASIKKNFSSCPSIGYPKPHLKSILQNMISNSLKYRDPERKLMIEIKTSDVKGTIFFTIKDNGLGFDSIKQADEMMKPFIRLHAHTEGTGLGLHIVKTILEYHNGSIQVESEPRAGAKFILKLN
ncbi:MAG: HAMP domain-containing sensor histidine kinase [Bacteroidota bacterium]